MFLQTLIYILSMANVKPVMVITKDIQVVHKLISPSIRFTQDIRLVRLIKLDFIAPRPKAMSE